MSLRGAIGQRRAHRSGRAADHGRAGLDDRHGITRRAVTDVDIGQKKIPQQTRGHRTVALAHRFVEFNRGLGNEIEDGRRIDRKTGGVVGLGEDFRRRQSRQDS